MNNAGAYKKYLPVAEAFAAMSPYKGTKVGALVLGPGFEVRSSGWNGAPRKCAADTDERSAERDERLRWVMHAEANAIANAARSGVSVHGCVLVVTHTPCLSCAGLIVQSGITAVLAPPPPQAFASAWGEDLQRSAWLFAECGVHYQEI